MKKTAFELEQFGKFAAKKYLQDNVPLNDTITKIASEHDLNKDQINRVVEFANISTHVSLFDKQAEKYVEFETADPVTVTKDLTKQAASELQQAIPITHAQIEDYYNAPSSDLFIPAELIKQAEKNEDAEEAPTSAERMQLSSANDEDMEDDKGHVYGGLSNPAALALKRQLEQIKQRHQHNMDKSIVLDGQYKTAQEKLANVIKQEILENGTSFYDIVHAIHTKYASAAVDQALLDSKQHLPAKTSFEKTANINFTVDTEHPIMKVANEINNIFAEYADVHAERVEIEKEEKEALAAWKPWVKGLLGVAALGTAATIGAVANENRRQQHQSYLNDIPLEYKR